MSHIGQGEIISSSAHMEKRNKERTGLKYEMEMTTSGRFPCGGFPLVEILDFTYF